MKTTLIILLVLLLAGCDERFRYPCQDPHNWKEEMCTMPFCSSNGTCPHDLAHYLKDKEKEKEKEKSQQLKGSKGICK